MMKKIFITAALAVSISMGLTSCDKCEKCTKESEPEVRVCEDDYGSKTEYGLTIDGLEAGGYTCK